jgi:AcrR family transcriptional regulator
MADPDRRALGIAIAAGPPPDDRLPRGRHTLSRAEVAANQRRRLLAAAAEIFAERGLKGATARLISERASVSNYTFYQHFAGVDSLLAANFEVAAKALSERIWSDCSNAGESGSVVTVALAETVAFERTERALATLISLALATAVPAVAAQRQALVGQLGSALDARWAAAATARPYQVAQLLIDAGLALIFDRLDISGAIGAEQLVAELDELIG